MRRKFSLLALALLTIVASSCSRDEDMTPVQPGKTVTYRDMVNLPADSR